MTTSDPSIPAQQPHDADQVEMILSHLTDLPTLSPIAVRVIQMSSDPEADLKEIATLIEGDPALSARVLRLCQTADRAARTKITTIERAVVRLGIEQVRAAMLAVEIYGLLTNNAGTSDDEASFDRTGFWRHSLAVACAAELIVERHQGVLDGVHAQEAFLCGLLHDLGKLALDRVLPRSFARCVELCRAHRIDITDVERRVLGIDHHTAGKRLAEHWGLPHALQDVIWLHNQPASSLPDVPHRPLIGVVTVAHAIVRSLHIGWNGSLPSSMAMLDLAREHGLNPDRCAGLDTELFERLTTRAAHLGIEAEKDQELLLSSIAEANRQLGRLNAELTSRASETASRRKVLDAIEGFHAAGIVRTSLASTFLDVAKSAASFLGGSYFVMLWQARPGADWIVHRFDAAARPVESRSIGRPPTGQDLAAIAHAASAGFDAIEVVRWLGEKLNDASVPNTCRFTALLDGQGPAAVLLHDREAGANALALPGAKTLLGAWASALAAAAQHDGARRLGEQLADANRRLAQAQSALVEARSMARLGELASGAAHEMNNPLTVISGNAQLLATRLADHENVERARGIAQAASQLSDLITSLHLFADPPKPQPARTDVRRLMLDAIEEAKERAAMSASLRAHNNRNPPEVRTVIGDGLATAFIDRRQIGGAVTELLVNALEARPKTGIELRAFVSQADGRLMLTVTDDGVGMSERALRHACDPFFSEKPAGRQAGLGLARARRLVDLHGGELRVQSTLGQGTTVTIALPEWRYEPGKVNKAA